MNGNFIGLFAEIVCEEIGEVVIKVLVFEYWIMFKWFGFGRFWIECNYECVYLFDQVVINDYEFFFLLYYDCWLKVNYSFFYCEVQDR